MTRLSKQALIMLKNSMDTNTTVYNIAWNHNYEFQYVWTNGRVENGNVFSPTDFELTSLSKQYTS